MFDELHDPHPPAITGRHLAEVAERAAGLRRRRNAIAGGVAAVALLAAGTVGVAATNRADLDPVEIADAPLPTVAPSADDSPAPTTTLLDPESLPPAVPVNPDPEDLPPATPVNPDTDGESTPGDGADAPGDSSGEPDGSDDAADGGPSNDRDDSRSDTGDATTLDVATAAALRADDPILAITTAGAAVWFPSVGGNSDPVTITSDADGLDFLADGTAVVTSGVTLQLIDPEGQPAGSYFGAVATTVDPTGATIAIVHTDGGLAVTSPSADDRSIGTPVVLASDQPDSNGLDVMWTTSSGLVMLAITDEGPALSIVRSVPAPTEAATIDGAITTVPLSGVTGADLRFAGVDTSGRIVLHDAGTATLFTVALDGAVTESGLDAPARSVWFDGTEVITVALDGTLTDTIGSDTGTVLSGTYLTARR